MSSSNMKLMPVDVCPICEGTGWKVVERAGLSGAEKCSCAIAARPEAIRQAAGIPALYDGATLENFKIPEDNPVAMRELSTAKREVLKYLRYFPAGDPPGLLIVGKGKGIGKTHLAIAVLKELINRGHEGLFFSYQDLLHRIHSGYDVASGSSDREAFRSALDTEILVLDDLGSTRKVNDWVEDTVTSIITHRCNQRKVLIATTNLDLEDTMGYKSAGGTEIRATSLVDVIGARARSRLFEMCHVVRMHVVEDYRIKQRR